MQTLIEMVGNEGVAERLGQEDINALLHGYWMEEQGDVMESPSDADYWLDESYRQWCEAMPKEVVS